MLRKTPVGLLECSAKIVSTNCTVVPLNFILSITFSKKLGPEWASAAKKLEGAVKFVAVDCTVAQDVCQK